MADLVLQAAGEEAGALDGDLFTVFVQAGYPRPVCAAGGEGVAGDGQAAFLVLLLVWHGLWDFTGLQDGVDHAAAAHLATLGIGAVVDEESLVYAHLVGGQAHAVGSGERFVHIRDQRGEVSDLAGVHLGGGVVQYRVATDDDRHDGHNRQSRI